MNVLSALLSLPLVSVATARNVFGAPRCGLSVEGTIDSEQWESYENFLADMGRKPSGLVLHRINKDGDFGPINCKWATPKEQATT
jgi:hypothetical protein